jgi:hypothetical protein
LDSVELGEESSLSCSSSLVVGLDLALDSLLGLRDNLGLCDDRTQESVKDSVVEIGAEGQLLNTAQVLHKGETRLLGQSREPATAGVDSKVTSRVRSSNVGMSCCRVWSSARSLAPAAATEMLSCGKTRCAF